MMEILLEQRPYLAPRNRGVLWLIPEWLLPATTSDMAVELDESSNELSTRLRSNVVHVAAGWHLPCKQTSHDQP